MCRQKKCLIPVQSASREGCCRCGSNHIDRMGILRVGAYRNGPSIINQGLPPREGGVLGVGAYRDGPSANKQGLRSQGVGPHREVG